MVCPMELSWPATIGSDCGRAPGCVDGVGRSVVVALNNAFAGSDQVASGLRDAHFVVKVSGNERAELADRGDEFACKYWVGDGVVSATLQCHSELCVLS